jgi:hypothetical protein
MGAGHRRVVPALVLALVASAASGCTRLSGQERRIARRLDELAGAASADGPAESPVARMAAAGRVGRYFTEDVRVEADGALWSQGRDAVVALAAQGRAAIDQLHVRVSDVEVTLSGSDSATAYLTLVVSGAARTGPDGAPAGISGRTPSPDGILDARELLLTLRRVDGDWLIAGVERLETLKRD